MPRCGDETAKERKRNRESNMERLSGLDATFLSIETPQSHMHVSMVSVWDTATVPGGYEFAKIRDLIERRLPRVPSFRRRLREVPFNLHFPVWVEDPDFDLDYHVRRVGVPAPGGIKELCELAGDFCSRPLDRSRPLWEMLVVEGLDHGHIGLLAKMHHSTIDGVSGAEMMVHLFDLEPEPAESTPDPEPAAEPEHVPSDLEMVAYAARLAGASTAQDGADAAGHPASVVSLVRAAPELRGRAWPRRSPRPAPRSTARSRPHRNVAVANLSLDDVKSIKRAFGTTVNDVVLALCSGALRRYLEAHDALPEKSLIAVVPISVRTPGAEARKARRVRAATRSRPCSPTSRPTSTTPSSGCAPSPRAPRARRRSTTPSAPPCCRTGPSSPPPRSSPGRRASTRA